MIPKNPLLFTKVCFAAIAFSCLTPFLSIKTLHAIASSRALRLFFKESGRERVLGYAAYVANRRILGPANGACLLQSLLGYAFLRPTTRGLRLVTGVGRDPKTGRVAGHSWLELDGRPLGDDPERVACYDRVYALGDDA